MGVRLGWFLLALLAVSTFAAAEPNNSRWYEPLYVRGAIPSKAPVTMNLKTWTQAWFACEENLREWCTKQMPDDIRKCMDSELKQYGLRTNFFDDLRAGQMYSRELVPAGYCTAKAQR
jgi:hypothetical protein